MTQLYGRDTCLIPDLPGLSIRKYQTMTAIGHAAQVQEEERLRKLEKQRQAGDLQRQEKSAVDRSSEAGAAAVVQPGL